MKRIVFLITILFSSNLCAEEWITEEVLKQLSEIRQELKYLQQEIKGLKESLANKPVAQAPVRAGKVDISSAPFIGNKDVKIAIVEFSDYQCPYCRRHFTQTLPDIKTNYIDSGKVKYVMKQYPLGFHAKAKGAAIAALCVEKLKPGQYWKAHESIFSGETKLNEVDYKQMAKSLGLAENKFNLCLENPEIIQQVDTNIREGEAVGVSGTPAFYIGKIVDGKVVNGQLVTGARPYASFSSVIDRLLKEG